MDTLIAKGREHAVARVLTAAAEAQLPVVSGPDLAKVQAQSKIIMARVQNHDTTVAALAVHILEDDHSGLETYSLRTLSDAHAAARGELVPPGLPPPPKPKPARALRLISYEALARARTTLADFTRFYLPLHRLTDRDFFRWLPILTFVEAAIYQLDENNEATCLTHLAANATAPAPPVTAADSGTEAGLLGVLRSHDLLTPKVLAELDDGKHYWALERRLCAAMGAGRPVALEDVYSASGLKSFDYRLLHVLLCRLCGSTASEALLRFLRVDEALTDIADDLLDYEKDTRRNSFNVLRGVVHATGDAAAAPLELASRIGQMEREHEVLLQALPAELHAVYCANRAAAMAKPGAEKWVFPRVVLPQDEARFRSDADAEADGSAESEIESDAEPMPWASTPPGGREAEGDAKRRRVQRVDSEP